MTMTHASVFSGIGGPEVAATMLGWEWNTPNPRWDFSADGQWLPTQSPVHRGHDGISIRLDNLTIPFPKWRNESIKAYGNAIVPQVMYEIFRAIEIVEQTSE